MREARAFISIKALMTHKDTAISLQYLIAIDIVGLVGENARSHTKEDRGCTHKLDVICVRGVEDSDGGIPLLLVPEGTLVLSGLLVNDAVILSEERRHVTDTNESRSLGITITLNAYFPTYKPTQHAYRHIYRYASHAMHTNVSIYTTHKCIRQSVKPTQRREHVHGR